MKLFLAFFVIFVSAFTLGVEIDHQVNDLDAVGIESMSCEGFICISDRECCPKAPNCRWQKRQ